MSSSAILLVFVLLSPLFCVTHGQLFNLFGLTVSTAKFPGYKDAFYSPEVFGKNKKGKLVRFEKFKKDDDEKKDDDTENHFPCPFHPEGHKSSLRPPNDLRYWLGEDFVYIWWTNERKEHKQHHLMIICRKLLSPFNYLQFNQMCVWFLYCCFCHMRFTKAQNPMSSHFHILSVSCLCLLIFDKVLSLLILLYLFTGFSTG